MTPKEQLIEKAKSLGIETKGLTIAELETAIAAEEQAQGNIQAAAASSAAGDNDGTPGDNPAAATGAAPVGGEGDGTAQGQPQDPAAINVNDPEDLTGTAANAEAEETDRKTSFSYRGAEYGFKKNAPARFNFLGQNKSREEWLQDEDAMELLVAGNCSFIKQLKK